MVYPLNDSFSSSIICTCVRTYGYDYHMMVICLSTFSTVRCLRVCVLSTIYNVYSVIAIIGSIPYSSSITLTLLSLSLGLITVESHKK